MNETFKKCTKCKIEKSIINFQNDKKQKDGLYKECKVCSKQNYKENLVRNKNFYLDNRDWIKIYYLENQDQIKEYQLKNLDKIIARKEIYSNDRYKTDIHFRLICKNWSRIRQSLIGKSKSTSKLDILGIDIETYRKWIGYQVTWDELL